jgi:hypothetical protein
MRATVVSAEALQQALMPSSTPMVVASCWSDKYLRVKVNGTKRFSSQTELGISENPWSELNTLYTAGAHDQQHANCSATVLI